MMRRSEKTGSDTFPFLCRGMMKPWCHGTCMQSEGPVTYIDYMTPSDDEVQSLVHMSARVLRLHHAQIPYSGH